MELIERSEPAGLIFEKVARCLEEVGQEAEKCPPDLGRESEGRLEREESEDNERGKNQIDNLMFESGTRSLDPFGQARARVPVRDSVG